MRIKNLESNVVTELVVIRPFLIVCLWFCLLLQIICGGNYVYGFFMLYECMWKL